MKNTNGNKLYIADMFGQYEYDKLTILKEKVNNSLLEDIVDYLNTNFKASDSDKLFKPVYPVAIKSTIEQNIKAGIPGMVITIHPLIGFNISPSTDFIKDIDTIYKGLLNTFEINNTIKDKNIDLIDQIILLSEQSKIVDEMQKDFNQNLSGEHTEDNI